MGLFSFGSKNKQDTVRDSGHFVKDDDAAYGERARAKRATHAGEGARRSRGPDPVLPEKKRARRRLVGAIALALAAAVGLPMLLDSEPKPLGTDIAINIPDKEKAAPLPVPAAATVDSGEEIVEPVDVGAQPGAAGAGIAVPPSDPPPMRTIETGRTDPAPVAKLEPKLEPKPEPVKPEPKRIPERPAVIDTVHPKAADLALKKAEPAAKPLDVKPKTKDDAARAIAILEDKPAVKAEGPSQKYVVQVAALTTPEKVNELQGRLRAAGVSSFTEKSGDLIRVRVGPFAKEEADKVRSKLMGIGLSGKMVPL
ncbi:SPOR domain-containing protein [Telluria aromaticivorans]|uniref:SPOR domain-containing protein n=1 Tax=Telluria aromaticivorans TaxID=2725995 RepID=A0A7Y2NYW7_9BURK|nr:SPOR domain-containing protein [Telluria aromaticivorans]NNG22404.1 SPOR domain-containing protein [Telluria aromaticivorans]